MMTSPDHKIGQILKLIYLRQYWSCSIDQKLKMSEMLMAIFLVYSTSGITSGKKVYRAQNGGHFENFEILNTASIWPQIWIDRPKLCQKKFFLWLWRHRWRQRVASKFLSIFMLRRGWLREQIARAMSRQKCQYHNCLSRLYMPKEDLNELHFSRLQVKGQHHRLTGWPWH